MKLSSFIPEIKIVPQLKLPKIGNLLINNSGIVFRINKIENNRFIMKIGRRGNFGIDIELTKDEISELLRNKDLRIE